MLQVLLMILVSTINTRVAVASTESVNDENDLFMMIYHHIHHIELHNNVHPTKSVLLESTRKRLAKHLKVDYEDLLLPSPLEEDSPPLEPGSASSSNLRGMLNANHQEQQAVQPQQQSRALNSDYFNKIDPAKEVGHVDQDDGQDDTQNQETPSQIGSNFQSARTASPDDGQDDTQNQETPSQMLDNFQSAKMGSYGGYTIGKSVTSTSPKKPSCPRGMSKIGDGSACKQPRGITCALWSNFHYPRCHCPKGMKKVGDGSACNDADGSACALWGNPKYPRCKLPSIPVNGQDISRHLAEKQFHVDPVWTGSSQKPTHQVDDECKDMCKCLASELLYGITKVLPYRKNAEGKGDNKVYKYQANVDTNEIWYRKNANKWEWTPSDPDEDESQKELHRMSKRLNEKKDKSIWDRVKNVAVKGVKNFRDTTQNDIEADWVTCGSSEASGGAKGFFDSVGLTKQAKIEVIHHAVLCS